MCQGTRRKYFSGRDVGGRKTRETLLYKRYTGERE